MTRRFPRDCFAFLSHFLRVKTWWK